MYLTYFLFLRCNEFRTNFITRLYKAYENGNLNFNENKFQNVKIYYERDLQEPTLVEGHRVFFGITAIQIKLF